MPRLRGQLRYSSNKPTGARVPKPSITPPKGAVAKDPSIFTGLPEGSIGKHLGQFKKSLDFLKGVTKGF